MKFAAIVALPVLSLVCPAAAQAAWSGWARCELKIMGPDYTNIETHDWVADFNTAVPPGSTSGVTGTWRVTGSGEWSPTGGQHSRWSMSTSRSTQFEVQESGGTVSIKRTSQPGVTGGIAGYTIPGQTDISATQSQWAFPPVMGSSPTTELKNPAPPPLVVAHPVGAGCAQPRRRP